MVAMVVVSAVVSVAGPVAVVSAVVSVASLW